MGELHLGHGLIVGGSSIPYTSRDCPERIGLFVSFNIVYFCRTVLLGKETQRSVFKSHPSSNPMVCVCVVFFFLFNFGNLLPQITVFADLALADNHLRARDVG